MHVFTAGLPPAAALPSLFRRAWRSFTHLLSSSTLLLLLLLQIQFYAHGMGMNPAERRFRLSAAFAMEAAVLLMLAAEHRK